MLCYATRNLIQRNLIHIRYNHTDCMIQIMGEIWPQTFSMFGRAFLLAKDFYSHCYGG